MQNPEDALVRPDYELILCIDYLLKVRESVKILRFFLFTFAAYTHFPGSYESTGTKIFKKNDQLFDQIS